MFPIHPKAWVSFVSRPPSFFLPQHTCISLCKLQALTRPTAPIFLPSPPPPRPTLNGLYSHPAFINFGKRKLLILCLFLVHLERWNCFHSLTLGNSWPPLTK